MKNVLLAIAALTAFGVGTAHAQLRLDTVIQNTATELSTSFERGYGVAVLAMHSDSARMSDHLISEMIVAFMTMQHARGIIVVNRMQLNTFAAQLDFDTAGSIDSATAQSLGTLMNVRYVVTGTFEPRGDIFHLSVQVIDVEAMAIRSMHSDVQVDGLVASLMDLTDRPIPVAEPRPPIEPRQPREPRVPREPGRERSLGLGPVFNTADGRNDHAHVSHYSFGGWFFANTRIFEFSFGVLGGTAVADGERWQWLYRDLGGGGWDSSPPSGDNGAWWNGEHRNVNLQDRRGGTVRSQISTLNLGFNWRIPFDVHDRITVFPILGFGLDFMIVNELIEWPFEAMVFTNMRFNFGGGADFDLTDRVFIRVQLKGYYGLFFARLFFPQDSHYPHMFGFTPRIGIGFRL